MPINYGHALIVGNIIFQIKKDLTLLQPGEGGRGGALPYLAVTVAVVMNVVRDCGGVGYGGGSRLCTLHTIFIYTHKQIIHKKIAYTPGFLKLHLRIALLVFLNLEQPFLFYKSHTIIVASRKGTVMSLMNRCYDWQLIYRDIREDIREDGQRRHF